MTCTARVYVAAMLLAIAPVLGRPAGAAGIPAAPVALGAAADDRPAARAGAAAGDPVMLGAPAADVDALVARAMADLALARTSGDPSGIARATALVDAALAVAPRHYGARRTLAWVRMARHEFAAARQAAEAAATREPADGWNLALLADACTELGDYACAEAATDRLTAMHPGAVAYTRVAALRALFGDVAGAIGALEAALAATDPRDAAERAWLLVQLGLEHERAGDPATAARAHEAALRLVPDHHLALPALAQARVALGAYDDALALLERALERLPTLPLYAALGDVHALRGDVAAARRLWAAALAAERLAAAQGVSYGREAALFLADHGGDLDEALRLVRAEARVRDDVYTADVLAWVLHRRGDDRAAMRAAHRALRLGTPDARFQCHVAAIAGRLGRAASARRAGARCLALDPTFALRLDAIARAGTDGPRAVAALAAGTRHGTETP